MSNYEFKILIVDDNPEIHTDFQKVLGKAQDSTEIDALSDKIFGESTPKDNLMPVFQIDSALQGLEGIEKVRNAVLSKAPYALAFVDVRMPPGLDGVETVKEIWKLDRDIQVVICTAYSDYSWEATVKQLGKKDNFLILKKPFDLVAVRQIASALTKKWQLLQDNTKYMNSLETSIKERTSSLEQSLSRLRATLESSADGILVVDRAGKVVDYNQKFVEIWRIPPDIMANRNFSSLQKFFIIHVEKAEEFIHDLRGYDTPSEKFSLATIKMNDSRTLEYYSQPQKLADEVIARVYSFRDITKHTRLQEELQHQATHDSLTGLPNRISLETYLDEFIPHSAKIHESFAVIIFDLAHFKLINDSLSHEIGDGVLGIVAERFKNIIKPSDFAARVGGDEFALVIPYSDIANVKQIAERIISSISKSFDVSGRDISLSLSIGISLFPQDGKDKQILLRNADAALDYAKKMGSNHYRFYTEDLNQQSLALLEIHMQLYHALENNELFLMYQPQFDLRTKELSGFEALVRWNNPTRGLMQPLEFIQIAEDSGLIISIGEWILRTACKKLKELHDKGYKNLRMGVNVTAHQINQPRFVDLVMNTLKINELDPNSLELELTENSIINAPYVIETLNNLKKLGVRIALDDFGTGYSSLNYLTKLHLDRLKIDKSFVQNLINSKGDEVVVQAIINMAKSLHMGVIAEGVENQQQLDYLKEQKCLEIQGFLFSKPLSDKQVEQVLKDKSWSKKHFDE